MDVWLFVMMDWIYVMFDVIVICVVVFWLIYDGILFYKVGDENGYMSWWMCVVWVLIVVFIFLIVIGFKFCIFLCWFVMLWCVLYVDLRWVFTCVRCRRARELWICLKECVVWVNIEICNELGLWNNLLI